MDAAEEKWISKKLAIGDKSSSSIYRWKSSIRQLPKYLSKESLNKFNQLDEETNKLLRNHKKLIRLFITIAIYTKTEKSDFLNRINIRTAEK